MNLYTTLLLLSVTIHIPTEYRTATGTMETDTSTCSGVIISKDTVLTAAHCVDVVKGVILVKTSDNRIAEGELIKKNEELDLATIRIDGTYSKYSKLGPEPAISDKVFTVNAGLGIEHTYGEGFIQNITKYDQGDNHNMIFDSIMIHQGASGSGLFDDHGNLVGILVIKTEAGSMAVDTKSIRQFLQ